MVERAILSMLAHIGEDVNRDGLKETPHRVAKYLTEATRGYEMSVNLKTFEGHDTYDQMITVGPVPFYSLCEHHLVPFFGSAWVAYIPDGRIVGLSKLARLVEKYALRLQVQERMTAQIGDDLVSCLNPSGAGVKVTARHLCMEMRGVKKPGAETVTTWLHGSFRDGPTRSEFLRGTR